MRLPHTGKRKCRGPRLTSRPAWRDGVKEKGMLCNVMHESMNLLYFSSELFIHGKLILGVYFWFIRVHIILICFFMKNMVGTRAGL